MRTKVTFRPLTGWPGGKPTPATARTRSPFSATYTATLELLDHELRQLAAHTVAIQLAITERDIRLDGWPRANAYPSHPGVVLSFESRHGPLQYATDSYRFWEDNLRAIALSLEALRKVDRYGVARSGEQYRGWRALEAPGNGDAPMTREQAARFIATYAGTSANQPTLGGVALASAFRLAAKRLHPDAGGDPALFRRLQQARQALEESA